MPIKRFLYYITNNLEQSKHEEMFDIVFFVINTLALIFGCMLLVKYDEPHWIPFLVIEYIWALDTMRQIGRNVCGERMRSWESRGSL